MEGQTFTVSPELAGQTLGDITKKFGGDVGTFARYLGIGENQPLTAGQALTTQNVQGFDSSGSLEAQLLSQIFGPGMSGADFETQKQQAAQQKLLAPVLQQLEAGKAGISGVFDATEQKLDTASTNLEGRYQQLLKDITEGTGKALTSEFAAKGIQIGSPEFENTLAQRTAPLISQAGVTREEGKQQILDLITQLAAQETQQLGGIDLEKAKLSAAGGQDAIANALSFLGLRQDQAQFDTTAAISKANQEIERLQLDKPARLEFQKSNSDILALDPYTGDVLNQIFGRGLNGTPDNGWGKKP